MKLLLETDILAEFLFLRQNEQYCINAPMLVLMQRFRCFTSIIQTEELFACADNEEETEYISSLFHLLRVLGIPSKYAPTIAKFSRISRNYIETKKDDTPSHSLPVSNHLIKNPLRFSMTASIAQEAKLAIITRTHFTTYQSVFFTENSEEKPVFAVYTPETLIEEYKLAT